jgi:hypothetical protein
MFSTVAKCVLLRPIFRVGNNQKSLGARSGEHRGWEMTGCVMQFRGNCATSDRDSGFCIMIKHGATHHFVQQFLADKSIPVISQTLYFPDLALTFDCSLL